MEMCRDLSNSCTDPQLDRNVNNNIEIRVNILASYKINNVKPLVKCFIFSVLLKYRVTLGIPSIFS